MADKKLFHVKSNDNVTEQTLLDQMILMCCKQHK